MSDAPTKVQILWDCEHGCPPIELNAPIEAEPAGNGEWFISMTEEGNARMRHAVTLHLRLVHGVS